MTPTQFLKRAFYIRLQIKDVDERIEQIRHRMSSVGAIRYDKINVQSSPDDPMLSNIAKLMEAEQKLIELEAQLETVSAEIRAKINEMDNELYKTILIKRYIYNKPIKRIAYDINYSLDWTWDLHRRALKAFNEVLNPGQDGQQRPMIL